MSKKRLPRTDYTYAVGRVRTLEKKLVSKAVFHEAAVEKDFSDAIKVIGEAGAFTKDMSVASNALELDKLLRQEWEDFLLAVSNIFLEKEILGMVSPEHDSEAALAVALDKGYVFISDYFRHKIDLGNLKILARAKYKELPLEKYRKHLLTGGFVVVEKLYENYDLSWDEIKGELKATPYSRLWDKALDTLKEQDSFVMLERGIEDFLMLYLRRAKYIVFGPEPLFAYSLAKRKELDLMRLLGVGKLLDVPTAIIQNRLSETYV